jgi:hypothetical protein
MERTAVKAAETLKGTGSLAYRNAKFGRGSRYPSEEDSRINSSTMDSTEPVDLDALHRETAAKSSWWSSSSGASAAIAPVAVVLSSKVNQVVALADSIRSDSPSPDSSSAVGRFLGRFGKPTIRPSSPLESDRDQSVAVASVVDSKALDDFFGQPSAPSSSRKDHFSDTQPKRDYKGDISTGFDGLTLNQSRPVSSRKAEMKKKKGVEVFDPFEENEDPETIMSTALAPSLASPSSPSLILSPFQLNSSVIAPTARTPNQNQFINDFDTLFSSSAAPSTSIRPILPSIKPQLAPLIAPPPVGIAQNATRSPLSISPLLPPPPSSSSFRGSFSLAPPPRPASAVSTPPLLTPKIKPPTVISPALSKPGSTLSSSDLSFFESM